MGNENPNAQIEANLLEGKNRYASAGTTLEDIKHDLDNIAAGLQSSWLGPAYQDYQDKHGKLTTTVQSASDVLQKGSTSIGKMYDSYIEADEKQKVDKEIHETLEMFMGVFMIVTSLLGLIGPILEAADLLFGIEIEALDIGIEVGEVATDVAEDVAIEEVETLSSLDTLGDIDPLNGEIPDPVDNTPNAGEAPPETGNVEPPQQTDDATSYGGNPTAEDPPDDLANENFQSVHTGDTSIFQNDDGSITQITVDENGDITFTDFENADDFFNSIYDDYAGPETSTSSGETSPTASDGETSSTASEVNTPADRMSINPYIYEPEEPFDPFTSVNPADEENPYAPYDPENPPNPVPEEPDPNDPQSVSVLQPDGTVTTTNTWPDGTQSVEEFHPDGTTTTTTTVKLPSGTVIETTSNSDGTEVSNTTYTNGDMTVHEVQTVNDPQTGQPVKIQTTSTTVTNSQGLPTVTEIVENPLNGTETITETVNNANGSQTVTTTVTDTSGNVISFDEQTIPPADSIAGPSTVSTSKRPFPDNGPPEAGPSTQKSKGKEPIR